MKSLGSLPGLPGLFIAGIFSASMSSVSSFVNSLAAVTLEDYIKPILFGREQISEAKAANILKLLAFIYGLICIMVTYLIEQMSGILQASLTVFGVVGGPLLSLYTLGMCTKSCNSTGALISFITSLAFGFWIGFGTLIYGKKKLILDLSIEACYSNNSLSTTSLPNSTLHSIEHDDVFYLYKISYMWYAGITWLLSVILGLIISSIRPNKEVDPKLLTPLFNFCCNKEWKENISKHTSDENEVNQILKYYSISIF